MDAAEDRDIKFQRGSGDLVQDLFESLPTLLWKLNRQNIQVPRRWALTARAERIISLVRGQSDFMDHYYARSDILADDCVNELVTMLYYIARTFSRVASTSRSASAEAIVPLG